MNKSVSAIFSGLFILAVMVALSGCSAPEPPTPAQPQVPAESEPPPASSTTPAPGPEIPAVVLNDSTGDFFDKSGNPTSDEPYLDIVSAELTSDSSNYLFKMDLNGPLPDSTPDSTFFYEWNIYVDADSNPVTGRYWSLIENDLGCEYMARLTLLDSNYNGELYDLVSKNREAIQYTITGTMVEFSWPKKADQPNTFDFIVAAKKYGERGSGSAFMLADKSPEIGHCSFPEGCVDIFTSSGTPLDTMQFTDPENDLFDKKGKDVQDEPYLDIVETTFSSYGNYGILTILLKGDVPSQTDDPSECLFWGFTLDTDNNSATGQSSPMFTNDLGAEYQLQLYLCGTRVSTQLLDLAGKRLLLANLDYRIDKNTIQIRTPLPENTIESFRYVALARKYGNYGAADGFQVADKAPDEGYYKFPEGTMAIDTDKDGFPDEEETSFWNTDPQIAENWEDLDTVTSVLNTPKKVAAYLKRMFSVEQKPSKPFSVPVTILFNEMRGDCDEYAILASYFLAKNGYEPYFAKVSFDKEMQGYINHDVCFVKADDGSWYSIDIYSHYTGNLVGPFETIEEYCKEIPGHYGDIGLKNYELYDYQGNPVMNPVD